MGWKTYCQPALLPKSHRTPTASSIPKPSKPYPIASARPVHLGAGAPALPLGVGSGPGRLVVGGVVSQVVHGKALVNGTGILFPVDVLPESSNAGGCFLMVGIGWASGSAGFRTSPSI